ncbi:MAG TPA: glycosyltransferase family 1 protein [Verrucomicrobiae bacterium]|jgi:glycosyltransferase involved in cell wall biosynthesis
MIKIGIDACCLTRPASGVGQVTIHLLKRFAALTPEEWGPHFFKAAPDGTCQRNFEFYLYLDADTHYALPDYFHKRVLPIRRSFAGWGRKWWEARRYPAAVRRDRCDALISLYQSAAVMPATFPHVMVVHDIIPALFPRYTDRLHKHLLLWLTMRGIKKASHCIAVSHHTREDVVRHLGVDRDQISVAHNAVDPIFAAEVPEQKFETVLKKYGLSRGYIYHGGGLDVRKNTALVMESYARLLKDLNQGSFSGPLPPLVISGALELGNDVAALAAKLGIADRVAILGRVPQEDLPALYKGAAVFLYPSRYEGFGLPLLEAMYQGVPAVAANTSSLPEVGGDAVLYCHPDDADGLARHVRAILTNQELREKLSRLGRQRAANFTWDALVRELGAVTGRLLSHSIKQGSAREAG